MVNDVANLTDRLFDRLFIFVNKFDQQRADDWDEEETRQYLAKTLLNGTVKPEHIYPVSALEAFLANWAQRQLKECGQLPGPETNSLTKDFGKAALGQNMGGRHWAASIESRRVLIYSGKIAFSLVLSIM